MTDKPVTTLQPNKRLKPCPFCGCKTIYLNDPHKGFKGSINCPTCLVSMPREVNNDEELINTWNERADV